MIEWPPSLDELLIAYRKAKSDLYYERAHANLRLLSSYELDLVSNLKLLQQACGQNFAAIEALLLPNEWTHWTLVPKAIEKDHLLSPSDNVTVASPQGRWQHLLSAQKENERPTAALRMLSVHNMHFHVLCS